MNMRFVLFVLALVSAPLFARSKTDVIVMTNGDRLTCEIKKLDHGVLYASLDYVDGTISIDWSKVERLESNQMFSVETESGVRYMGTLKTVEGSGDQPRQIEVVDDQAPGETLVEQAKVVEADQFGDSLWQKLHGTISAGFTFNKTNDFTQYNLSSELAWRAERTVAQVAYSSLLSSSSGTTTSTRNQVDLKVERLLRWDNWFYAGEADYLQSSAQGISAQTVFGGGLGHYFKKTGTTRIALIGGFAVQDTQYSDRPSQNNLVALIGGEVYVFRFKKVNLTVTPVLLPNLTDLGRVRFNLNAQYNIQIVSNWWWNISFYGNWDNRVPVGLTGSDYGTSVGLSYSFH